MRERSLPTEYGRGDALPDLIRGGAALQPYRRTPPYPSLRPPP
jgi:hypothetical protein